MWCTAIAKEVKKKEVNDNKDKQTGDSKDKVALDISKTEGKKEIKEGKAIENNRVKLEKQNKKDG